MTARRIAAIAFGLFVVGVGFSVADIAFGFFRAFWLFPLNTLLFFVFAFAHALTQLGTRRTLVFLALSVLVSFLFETVGVLTGTIYGPYEYTNRLGAKLGVVPILIPLAWFMMLYASNTLAEILASGDSNRARANLPRSLAWNAGLAFLAAMAMTAWDLGMDPQMVAEGHWVWKENGAYFGIPLQNYVGWLVTTFTVFFLYRTFESTQPPRALAFDDSFSRLPVAAYAAQGLATILVGVAINQAAPALVTFFAMGAFLFAAIARLARQRLDFSSSP